MHNISANPIDLSGATFVRGIDFVFPDDTILSAGGRIVLVRNRQAFQLRYGNSARIAGEFANQTGLSNGGEWLALADAAGRLVFNFRYNDNAPWPTEADGSGVSLVFNADSASNPNVGGNWTAGTIAGGTPGTGEDTIPSPDRDSNGNGLSDFLDHVFGNTGGDTVYPEVRLASLGDESEIVISFRRNTSLNGITITPERSTDLTSWQVIDSFTLAVEPLGDERSHVQFHIPVEQTNGAWFRLRVSASQ